MGAASSSSSGSVGASGIADKNEKVGGGGGVEAETVETPTGLPNLSEATVKISAVIPTLTTAAPSAAPSEVPTESVTKLPLSTTARVAPGAKSRNDRGDIVRLDIPTTATLSNMERCISERYNFVSWLYRIRNAKRSHRYGYLQPAFIYCVLGPMMGTGFDGKLMSTVHCGSSVYNLVVAKDRVYSGCYDCTIRVWNPADDTCVQTMSRLTDAVECMAVHAGRLYSGTADSTLTVWVNKAAEKAANRLETIPEFVQFPTPPPTASGDDASDSMDSHWVVMWQYKRHHTGYITCMSFTDSAFYSGSFAHDILVFHIDDYAQVAALKGHTAGVNCLLHEGHRLFSGSYDKTIRVWDCFSHQPLFTMDGHEGFVYNMLIHQDFLFSGGGGSGDNSIRVWNKNTLEPAGTLSGHTGICYCMAVAKDFNKIYTGSEDKTIRVWKISEKKGVGSVVFSGCLKQHKNGVWRLLTYKHKLYSASMDHTICVWNMHIDTLLFTLRGHTMEVKCMAIHGRKLYSGSEDRTIKIWACT